MTAEPLVEVAGELLGADVGAARAADLDRAVAAALAAAGDVLDADELALRLRTAPPDDPLRRAFIEALTICETHLFRLPRQFDALGERVLPALMLARQATRRLRLWSAGCATGEEAWSLAILLEQVVPPGWDATVLATDIDEGALEHARRGVYGPRSFRETPEWVRSRWFTATADGWEVGDRLRRRVRFARSNLASDPVPPAGLGPADLASGGVDLVMCRNVLMYFTADTRARTAARLSECLAPGVAGGGAGGTVGGRVSRPRRPPLPRRDPLPAPRPRRRAAGPTGFRPAAHRGSGALQDGGPAPGRPGLVALADRLAPDVITMDVAMPGVDGLEATRRIMARVPRPIVLVSGVFTPDLDNSFRALEAGADIVAIAASTGGPPAVAQVLRALPADWPVPVLVVQHIGAGFDAGLVRYLDESCPLPVTVAEDGREPVGGEVHVSPAEAHLGVTAGGLLAVTAGEPIDGYRPSANHLFRSVGAAFGPGAAGVVLTGMGRDGADGLLHLRQAGGLAIAQDETTSTVYGMPRQAVLLGAAEEVLPVEDIARTLIARAAR